MRGIVTEAENAASFAAAQTGHDTSEAMFSGTIVPNADDFAVMARALWPVKAAAALMEYCGVPERTARAYARGDREPSMSVLWMLLESREGFRVLSHIAERSKPEWWLLFKRERELAALAKDIFKSLGSVMQS